MKIKEEWLHFLINRGFSAPGARATIEDLRGAKSNLGDEEFGQWLKALRVADIPKILAGHHFGRKLND